jgi:1-acyl-sn-glycerol-3-phosphate acyltransferase
VSLPTPYGLNVVPPLLRGGLSAVLLALNTLVGVTALLCVALVKLVLPVAWVRLRVDPLLHAVAEGWIANNGRWIGLAQRDEWQVRVPPELRRDRWYLVIANHQSWVDVFVLQRVFNRRIPLLKFFLKQQLIFVPLIGLAWWALDFPFMKRHSQRVLRAHPERRGDDVAAVRRSCERFALVPTSVMSFVEGTRFSERKHAAQGSPHRRLLRPRTGGVALALDAMGEQFHSLLDVTIFYGTGAPTFADLLSGRAGPVLVEVREREIPRALLGGNYVLDPDHRGRAQEWLESLWVQKYERLAQLAAQTERPGRLEGTAV